MPIYVFKCVKCGFQKEYFLSLKEKQPKCEKCKGKMKKILQTINFVIKK